MVSLQWSLPDRQGDTASRPMGECPLCAMPPETDIDQSGDLPAVDAKARPRSPTSRTYEVARRVSGIGG